LDRQLNFYSPHSEISYINCEAVHRPVRVEPRLFHLLSRCKQLWQLTDGAFDPTINPLLEVWGWQGRHGRIPGSEERRRALSCVGMDKVELDAQTRTIRFQQEGVTINLSSIGKGYALDRAAEILGEYQVQQALIHGGSSSICALGAPPEHDAWPIGLCDPRDPEKRIGKVALRDACLAVSGNQLNFLTAEGKRYGHIIDPHSGMPVQEPLLAAVVADSGADADALSTALLCQGLQVSNWIDRTRGVFLAWEDGGELRTRSIDNRTVDQIELWGQPP
jgi:thiamine biosynthesis lipoprotein